MISIESVFSNDLSRPQRDIKREEDSLSFEKSVVLWLRGIERLVWMSIVFGYSMPNVSLNHRKPNFFSTSFFTFQLLVTFIETIKSQLLVPDSLTQRISALFCHIILCTKFSMHLSWSRLQFFASRPHNQPEIDLQKDRYLWVSWAAVL